MSEGARWVPPRHARTARLLARLIAGVYALTFSLCWWQDPGLIGPRGILPARLFLDRVAGAYGSEAWWRLPTVFWWVEPSSGALAATSGLGVVLALVSLARPHPVSFAALWALYLSLVSIGQTFTSFGWELLLLETGFLAVFLTPLRGWHRDWEPPAMVLWLFRWLAFRLMLGAGLIKLRGDPCWRDLTCLQFHYETQPNPHPLSWAFHHLPDWAHAAGVLVNHGAELVLPWMLVLPWRWRRWAVLGLVAFQGLIIASGNLSWLNWLTLVICLSGLQDDLFGECPPRPRPRRGWQVAAGLLAALVAVRSVEPVRNLVGPDQVMITSHGDPLHLVNSYGAFGSIGRVREEITLEGTLEDPRDPAAHWEPYALPCQPGDPSRRPCLVTPLHLRLDWQMWFVPLSGLDRQRWLAPLLWRLLQAEDDVLGLFSHDPFDGRPPRAVRVRRWTYRFAPPGSGDWWERELQGELVRPLTADDPALHEALRGMGLGSLVEPHTRD